MVTQGRPAAQGFQHRQGLPLGDAAQHRKVGKGEIFQHVHIARHFDIGNPQLFDQRPAFLLILFIVGIAQYVQSHLRQPLLEGEKGVDHGFDILNRVNAYNGSDVDEAVRLPRGNRLEAFHTDAVADDLLLAGITPQFGLNVGIALEQGGYAVRPVIGAVGKQVKQIDPMLTELRGYPFGAQDFLFPLPGVNPMLGQNIGAVMPPRSQRSQQSAVAGGGGMVYIRLRRLLAPTDTGQAETLNECCERNKQRTYADNAGNKSPSECPEKCGS